MPRGGATRPAAWPGGRAPGPRSGAGGWASPRPPGLGSRPAGGACPPASPARTSLAPARCAWTGRWRSGWSPPLSPLSVIANTPISLTAPKRFLMARHQAEAAVRVALEVQHRVHDVLQHARAGNRPFLGHVAHQHGGAAAWPWPARVRWAAHSRTWATEPGAEVSWSE